MTLVLNRTLRSSPQNRLQSFQRHIGHFTFQEGDSLPVLTEATLQTNFLFAGVSADIGGVLGFT